MAKTKSKKEDDFEFSKLDGTKASSKITINDILTKQDTAYIHVETKNKSFLHMSKYLRMKGIKNNKFMLILYDSSLKDLDVFDPNLTLSQKSRINAEVLKNPWYFLREVVRISTPAGKLRFKMHPGNMALVWSIINSLDTIVELPRQQFKTVSICGILAWKFDFVCENSPMYFGNKSLQDAKNNLKRFKDIRNNYPDFIKASVFSKGDIDNQESILSVAANNEIKVHGNPQNSDRADLMGRGMSIPYLWEDEYAFINFNSVLMKAAAPAHSTVATIAENFNRPHAKIISTTPNNVDKQSGLECKNLMNDACEFIEEMYDWDRDTVKQYIADNSQNDFVYIKYTWKQIGLSEAWYKKQCRELLNDTLTINREINLAWTRSSDNSVFSEEDLLIIESILKQNSKKYKVEFKRFVPYNEEFVKHTFFISLYEDLDPNKKYFIGCDIAAGLSKDRSTIVITDPEKDFAPVGFFRSATIDPDLYGHLLRVLIKNHLPKSILFIENNSLGAAVISTLLQYIPKSIYYSYRIQDKDKTATNPATKTENIMYGINTNTTSRDLMFDELRNIIVEHPEQIAYKELYEEIKTLCYNKKGKIEHELGHHDDTLMGFLMVRFAVATGNNIRKFIGREIDKATADVVVNRGIPSIGNKVDGNKSAQFDMQDFVLLIGEGYSADEAMNILLTKGKPTNIESKAKDVNYNILNTVLNKG